MIRLQSIMGAEEALVFSTDSFVVTPWKFPGGAIGKLSVCGTINDLCMAGGIPRYLSLSVILEEGFSKTSFEQIVCSISRTAKEAGVSIVTGDTKVVEHGKGDGIYINTAGIGICYAPDLGKDNIQPGDAVLVSGPIGQHGAAVMMARGELPLSGNLMSDCAPLHLLSRAALDCGGVRILRDPTRGGLATTLNEFTEHTPWSIELEEEKVPVSPDVQAACELLGLDPLYSACEGRMVLICAPDKADEILLALRQRKGGENAARIGTVTSNYPGQVILRTVLGGSRVLRKLSGAMLPRIC